MTLTCQTVHALLAPVFKSGPRVIGIDGLDNCRKSALARRLSGHTQHTVISLDDLLDKNNGAYVDFIDLDRLRTTVRGGNTIIEGVCLLSVMEKAGLNLDLLIYVRRHHLGIWEGEDCLGLDLNLEEYLEKLKIAAELFSDTDDAVPKEDLNTEIIRYHHAFHPHENADLTFSWNDN